MFNGCVFCFVRWNLRAFKMSQIVETSVHLGEFSYFIKFVSIANLSYAGVLMLGCMPS